jgi:hypothetical protein
MHRKMDEVKAMTQAAKTTPNDVGARMRSMRLGMARAGRIGRDRAIRAASAADQALTEHGMAPQRLAEALVENAGVAREELTTTTRRARKRMAGNAKRTRQDLERIAKRARRSRAAMEKKAANGGRRRRWPWLLGIGAIAVAVTVVLRSRQSASRPAPVVSLNGERETDDGTPQPREAIRDEVSHRQ